MQYVNDYITEFITFECTFRGQHTKNIQNKTDDDTKCKRDKCKCREFCGFFLKRLLTLFSS